MDGVTGEAFTDFLQDLLQQTKTDDGWGTRVQRACETFWNRLNGESGLSSHDVEAFSSFLVAEPDILPLAQLIIPELRCSSLAETASAEKQLVMRRTADACAAIARVNTASTTDVDDELYRDKKTIFHDADIYRASIILFNRGVFDAVEEEDIREWLRQGPQRHASK